MCPGFNTKGKFYGIHQLLIVIFMFPWIRVAFNYELKNLINSNPTANLIKKQSNQFIALESALKNIQETQQSPELQLIKIKRFYDENKTKPLNNSFKINTNTIIRTQDSRNNGAKYLNETELQSNDDCLKWCLQNKQCNLAVYEEKNQGSCYLFDCGTADDYKCTFTKHNFYTSSILQINREKLENKNPFQQQNLHENDLVNLRTNVPINTNLTNMNNKSQTNLTTKQTLKEADNNIPKQKCEKYQFACKNGSDCIAIYNICDGIPQCPDGSDEAQELHCPDSSNQISQLLSINSKPTNEAPVTVETNKDLKNDKIILSNHFQAPNFNYKKLPEVIKLDKAPNTFQLNNQQNFPNNNNVKPWPSILNLDQNGYPITNWNDYSAYYNALNNLNNQPNLNNQQNSIPANSKDFNSMVWQMMDPNQQQQQQKNFFDALTNSNLQNQQQFLQNLFNKQQLNNWLDNSNKNSAALSFINYLNSKQQQMQQQQQQQQQDQKSIKSIDNNDIKLINQNPINLLNKNKTENIVISNIKTSTVETSTNSIDTNVVQSSNLNKARYISYDFKQPFIQYNTKDDFYLDDNDQDNNSAVIALILGLFITVLLIFIVGLRMRSIKKRIQRRGRATLAHDADYLINGMYL